MELIGLNGKKGSGKDTAGAYLVAKYGFERRSFAGPLKRSAAAALGLPPDEDTFEVWKNNINARIRLTITEPNWLDPGVTSEKTIVDISVREYLQFYGTEAHRDIPEFGPGVWTDMLGKSIEPGGKYVSTDARFVNECSRVKELGGRIITIQRDAAEDGDAHASEDDLPEDLVDTILYNNSSIEDLHATIDAYMTIAGALDGGGIAAVGIKEWR